MKLQSVPCKVPSVIKKLSPLSLNLLYVVIQVLVHILLSGLYKNLYGLMQDRTNKTVVKA